MFDRRSKNVEIFEDSMKWIKENEKLQKAVAQSMADQKVYLENENVEINIPVSRESEPRVFVSKKRSFEAASEYARAGKKVCVLNFASATNPGGGVTRGSSAQEEALCRCSTLYPCLNIKKFWDNFYGPHRKANSLLYNDDCIYTPRVMVFKSDIAFPERMKEKDWYSVDIITCAAPNLRARSGNLMNPNAGSLAVKVTRAELLDLLEKRIEKIFAIAATKQVEILILGAFGCGAFCNPPEIVAKAFAAVQKNIQDALRRLNMQFTAERMKQQIMMHSTLL